MQRFGTNKRRDITVAELFDHCTDSWKEEVVRECMGEQQLQATTKSAIKPKEQTLVLDKLIWNGSKGGSYSTKTGKQIRCANDAARKMNF